MEAFPVVRPCQEAPYLEAEIAYRQAESQQDLLVAGIQEAYPVEELAYLSNLSEFVSISLRSKSNTYQAGNWAFQEVVGILVADLVEAAACL
jgi:hypothetical protein